MPYMNYLLELKAFYDWLELNPLSPPEIALWHGLMYIANKTGWQQEFTVAVSSLTVRTGLNAQAIKRARNELKQCERIKWKPRGGNLSAIYEIISFVVQNEGKFVPQSVPQSEPQVVPQSEPQVVPQVVPINKHKHKPKQKKDTNVSKELVPFVQNKDLDQAIIKFVDFRKSIKKPMTEHAVELLVKSLSNLSPDEGEQVKILEQSILNGWQGVFPLKNNGKDERNGESRRNVGTNEKGFSQRAIEAGIGTSFEGF